MSEHAIKYGYVNENPYRFYQAQCTCGWLGTKAMETGDEMFLNFEKAQREAYKHKEEQ